MEQLNIGLDKALILISAPAGYGKTTLVSSWLQETKTENAWISLDEGDNDPGRFLQYLLTALQKVAPTIQSEMLSTLRGPAAYISLLSTITDEVGKRSVPFALVLDDFHVLHAQPVLDFFASLVEHAPACMHVILISRTDPLLPLSHLRVQNKIVEVRADQLRFTQAEINDFLQQVMALKLPTADIAALQARTEGWIAGIQLAALSMQGCEDLHAFITAFAGSHHYIIDYLTEEVLKRLPEKTSAFLLRTCVLNRMCGSLCDALAEPDPDGHVNGQEFLEELERKNLFLVPLDDRRHWYRYHHLFSDVLNRRLKNLHPQLPPTLHRRASQWFEQNGDLPEAIEHALLAGDQGLATGLVEQYGVLLLIRGEVVAVLRWIAEIEPFAQNHPWLYIFKAWAYALSGDLARVEGMLRSAEELISKLEPTQEVKIMLGAIAAARAHQANLMGEAHKAADFARQALEILPDLDLVTRSLRAVSASLLGDAALLTGDLEEARRVYIETARICQAAGDIQLTFVINSNLANVLVEQGSLRQAEKIYSETLSMATRPDGERALIAGRLLVELSQVHYEWNELEIAFQYTQQGLSLCQRWGNIDLQAVAFAQLARIELVNSHQKEMFSATRDAEKLLAYDLAPRYSIWVAAVLARLHISQGNLERAVQLVQQTGIDMENITEATEISHRLEPMYLIILRSAMAQGKYGQAIDLSNRLLVRAEGSMRIGRMIEILVLQAMIYSAKNDMEQGLAKLNRAILLAQPEGYVRVFLDEGEPMLRLLYQAKIHQVGGGYVSELLAQVRPSSKQVNEHVQVLIEPLTIRELEVLKLIEQGCTNQDIADRLVISIPTVKRHISNIYSKLGVKNRTQAISVGKDLNIFV